MVCCNYLEMKKPQNDWDGLFYKDHIVDRPGFESQSSPEWTKTNPNHILNFFQISVDQLKFIWCFNHKLIEVEKSIFLLTK